MAKPHLGLGDYQVLRYRAVERYLHLVFIAHLLLTHLALTASDAQAEIKNTRHDLRLPSIPQLQQRLRETLVREALANLEKRPRLRSFARKMKELFAMSG